MESKVIQIEGLDYVIYEDGSIKKRKGKGIYKAFPDKDGYLKYAFCIDGVTVNRIAHRLCYEAFVGPIPPGLTIDHKDNDKLNNHYSNLQVMRAEDNAIKGNAKHWVAVSPDGDVVEIYNLKKFCRDNNLHKAHLYNVLNGKPHYNAHRGWRKYNG